VTAGGLLALAGCTAAMPPQRSEVDFSEQSGIDQAGRQIGLQVLTVPEGQRVMLIKSPEDVERVCSPRESDEGMSVSEGLSLDLAGAGEGVGMGESVGERAVPLSHPTALVLLARELLFRACELSLNLDADAEETRDIYERFLATLEAIAPTLPVESDEGSDDEDED
jgi:hypothetical protein